ncbi:hypothetical protein L2E82_47049 [Cichorium intybus]|uniref:Uncharacterized protein n=1 Tax=Cichorium intybus TaxID=13427 RepID=A0ACB8YVJ1_CICIN|nr:hypothetical protein L2E82_47049 [Cichorium intybus]
MGEPNNLYEIKIVEHTCAKEEVGKGRCTSELGSQPERSNTRPKGLTTELGLGNNEEWSIVDKSPTGKNEPANERNPIGSPKGEKDSLEVLRAQACVCPTQVHGENAMSGERGTSIRNCTSRSSETGKEGCRNPKKWDGGMSMTLFNKMVRDSNKRRGFSGGKGKKAEKKNTWGQGISREEDHKAGDLGVQTQV